MNPVWNQTFDIIVEDGLRDLLILEIWDHDTFGKVSIFLPDNFLCFVNSVLVSLLINNHFLQGIASFYCSIYTYIGVHFYQDKIGRCIMTLTRVILEGEFSDSFPVDGTKTGKLNLHLKWTPQPILRDL